MKGFSSVWKHLEKCSNGGGGHVGKGKEKP